MAKLAVDTGVLVGITMGAFEDPGTLGLETTADAFFVGSAKLVQLAPYWQR
jgi:hypothetical protein